MNKRKLKAKYQTKVGELVRAFKKIEPEKIILFGSAAYGNIDPDSDIDICVIKETKDRLGLRRQLREIIWQEKIGFDPEIDIHVYPPEIYYDWLKRNDPFIEEIEKGKVMYEKR